jgi:hypothetical protein
MDSVLRGGQVLGELANKHNWDAATALSVLMLFCRDMGLTGEQFKEWSDKQDFTKCIICTTEK